MLLFADAEPPDAEPPPEAVDTVPIHADYEPVSGITARETTYSAKGGGGICISDADDERVQMTKSLAVLNDSLCLQLYTCGSADRDDELSDPTTCQCEAVA
eukprot:gnl/TRDRNA2_/TRDRNA2_121130_c0_seq1.p2 gnl/TRDRNA2_/TRDRNA2_121130_c0~~gnl/TRDRNA2_/TRDRNA2_121130_c0_seq1.p2  ORF type:complete len:101 (+),score=19.91 gnl/TRDRNA2_/TRDRNA2_121130_c0_seq1:338-640(+)